MSHHAPRRFFAAGPWLLTALVSLLLPSANAAEVAGLRCEFMTTPLGIEDVQPGLSWTIVDDRRDVAQVAYRVLVSTTPEQLERNEGDLWDSGEVAASTSHLVPYAGQTLTSRQRCFWKVQVKLRAGTSTDAVGCWSTPSWWEMGLLKPEDWQGSWIQSAVCKPIDDDTTRLWTRQALIPLERNEPAVKGPTLIAAARTEGQRLMASVLPAPVFRTAFEVPGQVRRARLYISGLGFQEAYVNGRPVSDRFHDPSVNNFKRRGGYVTHDITELVTSGRNVVSAIVGGGWWYETLVWGSPDKFMGLPSLRAQIEVDLVDGKHLSIPTDGSWTTAIGPVLKTHYYAGEAYDARRAPGWTAGNDDGQTWVAATAVPAPVPALVAQRCEPERVVRRVQPVAVTEPRPGIFVFDLGQLIMGTVELNVQAPAGTAIVMRTAEWTWNPEQQGPRFKPSFLSYDQDEHDFTPGMIVGKARGSTYFSFSFAASGLEKLPKVHLGVPTLVYVARGDASGETWHPRFTTHPFRYIEVQGLKTKPTTELLTGLVITNDEEVTGHFTSSNQRFNAIWEASMNSTRYTTHGMTWDNACERLQSQVYNAWSAPFASYVLWYPNLWRKILEDQRLGNVLQPREKMAIGNAIYGSRSVGPAPNFVVTQGVTVELPLAYYDRFGDQRELALHYPHMKAWVEAFFPKDDGVISDKATMGAWNDHFFLETSADAPWSPEWDTKAMMSMMLAGYAKDVADAARILGKPTEANALDQLAEKIRNQVNKNWYDAKNMTYAGAKMKTGDKTIDTSTGWHGIMAMAIAKQIAPEADVTQIVDNCIADMKKHYLGHHAAGHITHQLLYDVYSDHGLIETCYDMMNATGYPSFTWMLQSGNRTIPEGPTLPDTLPAKASAYQNECQEPARWFTQTLCGVSPDRHEAGFKHLLLRPQIPAQLSEAHLDTTTPYGVVESSWQQTAGVVTWTVRIPANSHATAWIPTAEPNSVHEGNGPLDASPGCKISKTSDVNVECELGSGVYVLRFAAPRNQPSRLGDVLK